VKTSAKILPRRRNWENFVYNIDPLTRTCRGVNIEERIDIHTQTFGAQRKPPPPRTAKPPATVAAAKPYDAEVVSDNEWKTQSLPSLGRVSSDNTLESSAEEYAPARSVNQKRSRKVMRPIFNNMVCPQG
jgi:hypothetical protein